MNDISDEKLEKFKEEIKKQALKEEAAVYAEIEAMTKADLDKTKDTVLDEAYHLIQQEVHELEQESLSQYAARQLDLRRHLADERSAMEQKIFEAVRKRLESFAASPEYPDFLKKQIAGALKTRSADNIKVKISPKDEPHLPFLKAAFERTSIETDSAVELGGTLLSCAERGYIIDLRLEALLEEQRRGFRTGNTLPLD